MRTEVVSHSIMKEVSPFEPTYDGERRRSLVDTYSMQGLEDDNRESISRVNVLPPMPLLQGHLLQDSAM